MTADKLHKMQQECKNRHGFFDIGIIVPKDAPRTYAELIDESYEFREGDLKPKKAQRKKREKIFLPDLMAAQIPLPCSSDKKESIPVIKKDQGMSSIFDKPYVPKPVQQKEKRPYVHFKALPPDPPKQKKERPPAVYNNTASYYGIYDELKEEWNKKTG